MYICTISFSRPRSHTGHGAGRGRRQALWPQDGKYCHQRTYRNPELSDQWNKWVEMCMFVVRIAKIFKGNPVHTFLSYLIVRLHVHKVNHFLSSMRYTFITPVSVCNCEVTLFKSCYLRSPRWQSPGYPWRLRGSLGLWPGDILANHPGRSTILARWWVYFSLSYW